MIEEYMVIPAMDHQLSNFRHCNTNGALPSYIPQRRGAAESGDSSEGILVT